MDVGFVKSVDNPYRVVKVILFFRLYHSVWYTDMNSGCIYGCDTNKIILKKSVKDVYPGL